MGLIHRDHVVEQVAATAFDPTLGNSVLPGTFEGSSCCRVAVIYRNACGGSSLYAASTPPLPPVTGSRMAPVAASTPHFSITAARDQRTFPGDAHS